MKKQHFLLLMFSIVFMSCSKNEENEDHNDYSHITGAWIPQHPTAKEINTSNETVTQSLIELQKYVFYRSAFIFSNKGNIILYEGDGLYDGQEDLYQKGGEVGKGIYNIKNSTISIAYFDGGKSYYNVPINISDNILSFDLDETPNYQELINQEPNNNTIIFKAIITYKFKRK